MTTSRFNFVLVAFLIVTFLVGIAGAFQLPVLSLFLKTEVKTRQFFIGMFYTVNAVAGIVVSFWLAKYSDVKGDRKKLIIFCCLMAAANGILFAFNRHYLTLITLGILFSSIASSIQPQLFALAREYAEKQKREVVMFTSLMRAQISLAWVIGPPLAYLIMTTQGFTPLYLTAASVFVLCGVAVTFILPSSKKERMGGTAYPISTAGWRDVNVRHLFYASVLMWTSNTMYIIDMPIYATVTLGYAETLPGWLMGMAAGVEIPIMLLAGYIAPKFGKKRLMLLACAAAVAFYIGLLLFSQLQALFALQLFNAVFIGILAGIGMLYFQDLMPGRPGVASTLFTNSISTGVILAGVLQGAITELGRHWWVYLVTLTFSLLAMWWISRVRDA